MGFTKKVKGKHCVFNDVTRKVIVAKGKRRCYSSKHQAELVLSALDCHYTGRRCKNVVKLAEKISPRRRRR